MNTDTDFSLFKITKRGAILQTELESIKKYLFLIVLFVLLYSELICSPDSVSRITVAHDIICLLVLMMGVCV